MSHYTGSIPDSLAHSTDWLEHAVCKDYPDAMHPDNNEAGIAYAKTICGRCPVQMACLQDALRTGDTEHSIRGGLRPNERRALAKRLNPGQYRDAEAVAHAVRQVQHPGSADRSLQDIWEERTYPLPGGHLGWRGDTGQFNFQGRPFTPKQLAFFLDRGREPVGIVRRVAACPVVECVHPRHLADNHERHQQAEKAASR